LSPEATEKALSIRELKNNPSTALREALANDLAGVKFALAVALFRQGRISLG